MQYANFMPGEWLPDEDQGYLQRVYAHAAKLGVGVGGPDLLPFRAGQQHHSLPRIARRKAGLIAALAVQGGNLAEVDPASGLRVTATALDRCAREQLHLDCLFWGTEAPYCAGEVVPLLCAPLPAERRRPDAP